MNKDDKCKHLEVPFINIDSSAKELITITTKLSASLLMIWQKFEELRIFFLPKTIIS